MWLVYIRVYAGEDYWYDYPPLTFDSENEARIFASKQQENGASVEIEFVQNKV